jgi:hypothetical protein
MRSAAQITVSVMGTLMGLAGLEHGIGEILQGNTPPEGFMIRSWPDSAFFQSLNGEPALTILPNLLLTGLLAMLFSSLFVAWSIRFAHRADWGKGLMLLALPMLLFGAGIFPPILGFLIGAFAHRVATRRPVQPDGGRIELTGRGWPWVFAACCAAWLALFPGVAVLGYFFGINNIGVTLAIMAAAFILLPLSFWSSVQQK